MLMAAAAPLSFATWSALIGNYSVEVGGFNGAQYGVLQSVREVPGFLAFAVIFVLLLMREQTLAIVSLLLSCLVPLAPARGNEVRAVIASRAAVMR